MSAGKKFGDNAFKNKGDPRGMDLSPLSRRFLGRLIDHVRGLPAIAAPCVNSYKRLVPRGSRVGATSAPVNVAWDSNNRKAFVRIPGGRLELRVSNALANPYLLTVTIIYAGLDGVKRKLYSGALCNESLYEMSLNELYARGIQSLPASLPSALDALEANVVLCTGLGLPFSQRISEA